MYVASTLFCKGVNLVLLDIGTLGSTFCGGMIGKLTQKMCVKQNCNITLHVHKCDVQNVRIGNRSFICAKTEDSESVLVQPSRYLNKLRHVEACIIFYSNGFQGGK